MAGLKKTYRVVGGNDRIYFLKSVREEAGTHPGNIIRLEVDNGGWARSVKVKLVEAGDQSPEAMEAHTRIVVRQIPDRSRVSFSTESAGLIQKDEG